jgi:uncharacterized peroxidase-related enzyme
MAYITVIEPDDASPALKDAYARVGAARGRVANVLKVHSVNPMAMTTHVSLYKHLLFGNSGLSRIERETIAVAVSAANSCAYCVDHHAAALRTAGGDPAMVAALSESPEQVALDARSRALVDFAIKLTRAPGTMSAADTDALRAVGFSDSDIHDANAIAAYFNFVNRMVLGLGVELEPGGGW